MDTERGEDSFSDEDNWNLRSSKKSCTIITYEHYGGDDAVTVGRVHGGDGPAGSVLSAPAGDEPGGVPGVGAAGAAGTAAGSLPGDPQPPRPSAPLPVPAAVAPFQSHQYDRSPHQTFAQQASSAIMEKPYPSPSVFHFPRHNSRSSSF